jgi:hypothetical protein
MRRRTSRSLHRGTPPRRWPGSPGSGWSGSRSPGTRPLTGHLQLRSLTGLLDDAPARDAFAELLRVEALLLALALETLTDRRARRQVRVAELALTLLHGAGGLAETAPSVVDPFDLARACGHLAGLDLADAWNPPHLPFVPPARPADETWARRARSATRSPATPST